jgi:putative DNA primase/helicase
MRANTGTAEERTKVEEEKAKAKAREDELLDNLAKLEGLEYARRRKEAQEDLGVSARDIDNEVRARREDLEAAPLYGHWIVEPWPEPVDGDSLLRDIIARIHLHVVISYDGALVTALWIMLSWVHDEVATHSPILCITSAEPESGKSTLMGLIALLMHKCISSVEASEAAIYRAIKRWQPSFCFDEFDSVLANDDKVALRSIINSGHTRGSGVLRCVGDDSQPELFRTFAPKAIGMNGRRLPPPTLSRCNFVEMRRRKKDEQVAKFEHQDDSGLAELRSRARRWAIDNEETLRNSRPSIPEELQNRRADNWRLQLAIADLCDGAEGYGERARAAAVRIEGKTDNSTKSVRALVAIKAIFQEVGSDAISSEDLISKMTRDEDSDWADWYRGKPITQAQLARLLKSYQIIPEQIRIGDNKQKRGYLRVRFLEAWERYT